MGVSAKTNEGAYGWRCIECLHLIAAQMSKHYPFKRYRCQMIVRVAHNKMLFVGDMGLGLS